MRGVLEVALPLENSIAASQGAMRSVIILIVVIGGLGLAGIWMFIGRIRRDEAVLARTLLTDNAPALIAYVDRNQRYQFTNNTYRDWFGETKSEIEGMTVREVVGEEAYQVIGPNMEKSLKGQSVSFETKAPSIKRGIGDLYARYTPDFDSNRVVRGVVVAIMETTRLRQLERDLDSILLNLPVGTAVFEGQELRFLRINQAFAQLNGLPIEDHLGKPLAELLPDAADTLVPALQSVLETGKLVPNREVPFRLPSQPDKLHHMLHYSFPILGTDGKPKAVGLVMVDVTERKEAEDALRAHQDSLVVAQKVAHFGSFERDFMTHQNWWSDEYYRILGVSRQECEASYDNFLKYIHPEDVGKLDELNAEALSGAGTFQLEYRIIRPSGEVRTLYGQVKTFADESGTPIRMVGTLLDLTERKQLEEQLLQAQKMEAIGTLAGGVAHDFNNILTGIMGYIDLLGFQIPDDPKVKADLSQVQQLADRAAKLTEQLLFFSRQHVTHHKSLDLNAVIESTLVMLRRIIGEDIQLKFIPDSDLGMIRADESQLGQVLVNLAANARDAMPRGGNLTIETANVRIDREFADTVVEVEPGDYIMWRITDTGSGMEASTQEKVFDPFFTTKEVGKGTGLGLSSVHGIVKEHGAHIHLESAPGQGTSFISYWPRVAGADQKVSEEEEANPPHGSETILVVEDETAVREMIQRVLHSQGYRVVCAGSAEEALDLFRRSDRPFDLLLTDVVMPDQSGWELYTQLASETPGLKALFISGYSERAVGEGGIFEQGMPFLRKPFRASELALCVRKAMDKEKIN